VTTDNFVPQTVGVGSVSTSRITYGGGSWAKNWGRTQPIHGTNSSPDTILGEVRSGVYTSDGNGVAYDSATTTWARVQCVDDTTATGEGELRQYWIGVPIARPAGYTRRNTRNTGPATLISPPGGAVTVSPTGPLYSPTTFLRNASGLYTPKDNSNTYNWGPWNHDNLADGDTTTRTTAPGYPTYNDYECFPATTTYTQPGVEQQIVGNTDVHARPSPMTPGYRSVGLWVDVAGQLYRPDVFYPNYQSCSGRIVLGAQTLTFSSSRSDLSAISNPTDYYRHNVGNLGALLMTTGDVGALQVYLTVNWSNGNNWVGGMNLWLRLCPRVDIPLPFTCTYGNEIAEGGVLTGSVPGF
jgi:hypothetical protein